MNMTSSEREALAFIRRQEGHAWKAKLRAARANGRLHAIARDGEMASVLQRFLSHPPRLDAVRGDDLDSERVVSLPEGGDRSPEIPIPLSPALAAFREALSDDERRVFDARLGLRRPLRLRLLAEELRTSVQAIHRIEDSLRSHLAVAGLEPPAVVYESFDDFKRGLTAREAAIFEGRFVASPPESYGSLGRKLGIKRQRAQQITDDLSVEMARGKLFVGPK